MKTKYLKFAALLVLTTMTISSCDKGFEELNTDPINIAETSADKLLAPAVTNVLSYAMLRNRNFNNELMQVTVSISDGDATVFRYEFRATTSDGVWNSFFPQITNFKDMYNLAASGPKANKSYQGIALVCQSWVFSMLTDTYGDIPYKDAGDKNKAKSGEFEPAFDRQKDIYLDMFNKLEEANTLLSANTAIKATSDPVFNGDITKWRKFCNSLYLRLLLRVSGKAEVSAAAIAKIKEIVDTNPAKYPIMQTNADCATILWTGGTSVTDPYTNPYYAGVRAQDFRSPAIGSFFIDHLRDWQDPRISIATGLPYSDGGVNRFGIAQGPGGFAGVPSGYSVGSGVTKQAYFYSYDQTNIGVKSLQQGKLTGIIMNYAEVQFILAEAALKGYISSTTAENAYNKGIAAAINYWVPAFTATPTANATEFNNYVVNGDIDWDNSLSTDGKMEMIHLQKYYALFLVDFQQWFEFRRTGHPVLPKGPGLRNNGVMPARMVYPIYVQSANPTNYKLAVAAQGADAISTNVWWQKP